MVNFGSTFKKPFTQLRAQTSNIASTAAAQTIPRITTVAQKVPEVTKIALNKTAETFRGIGSGFSGGSGKGGGSSDEGGGNYNYILLGGGAAIILLLLLTSK